MYYIGDEELKAVQEVFRKKRLYRYHVSEPTECDLFEKEFSKHMGTEHSLILSSGTNALVAALLAANIQPGDEVLIPAYTFVATAGAVVQVGAIPVIVNIDENLSLCTVDAEKNLSQHTKAIIPVHMDGLAANMKDILRFAQKNNLTVIEDVAQAIGGSYQSQRLGTMGLFGCYSLNESKNISCGEGGILITADRAMYEKAFCLHDLPAQFSPSKKDMFTQITPFMGGTMRVSEIHGAIMRVQLKRLETILTELRERKAIFVQMLQKQKRAQVILGYCAEGDCASNIHLQFEDPMSAMDFGRKLRETKNLFAPVTVRPAHAAWKWTHLFGEMAHIQKLRNPFIQVDRDYEYPTANYARSASILSRTLKMEISLDWTVEQTQQHAEACGKVLNYA